MTSVAIAVSNWYDVSTNCVNKFSGRRDRKILIDFYVYTYTGCCDCGHMIHVCTNKIDLFWIRFKQSIWCVCIEWICSKCSLYATNGTVIKHFYNVKHDIWHDFIGTFLALRFVKWHTFNQKRKWFSSR